MVNESNRPSIRSQKIQEVTPQLHETNTSTKVQTAGKVALNNDNIAQGNYATIAEESKVRDGSDRKKDMANLSKSGKRRVSGMQKSVHEPLNLLSVKF